MPFIEQTLIGDLLQRPPDGLDVIIVVGNVGVLHIRPVADAFGHTLPFALVFPYGLLAFLDERFDAVLLDLLLAVEVEELFDFQLNRQTVGIPAGFAQNLLALHRLIARNQILDRAGFDMTDVRLAVRRWRAVVEREYVAAFALVDRTLEDVVLVPETDDLMLARLRIRARGDLLKHDSNSLPISFVGHKKSLPPHGTKTSRYHPI